MEEKKCAECNGELKAPDGHFHSQTNSEGMPQEVCCAHVPKGSAACSPNATLVQQDNEFIQVEIRK
jgi:hypothetical protein